MALDRIVQEEAELTRLKSSLQAKVATLDETIRGETTSLKESQRQLSRRLESAERMATYRGLKCQGGMWLLSHERY